MVYKKNNNSNNKGIHFIMIYTSVSSIKKRKLSNYTSIVKVLILTRTFIIGLMAAKYNTEVERQLKVT